MRCQDRQDAGRRGVLHGTGRRGAAPVRSAARLLHRGDARRRGRRPVRLLHRQHSPDGHAAAQRKAEPVHPDQARPQRPAEGHRPVARPGAGATGGRAFRHRDRCCAHRRGDAGLGADRLADPRRRGAAPAAPPRRGPPRPAGPAGPGQSRRPGRLASSAAVPAVRSRRAAAPTARHDRSWPAGADQAAPASPPPGTCQRGSRPARCCWPNAPANPASTTPGRWPTTPGWRSPSG